MTTRNRWLAVGALCTFGLGLGTVTAARADRAEDAVRADIRHDMDEVRRDERKLDDLRMRRDEQIRHRDMAAARRTDREIDRMRDELDRDRDRLRDHQRTLDRMNRHDRPWHRHDDYHRW